MIFTFWEGDMPAYIRMCMETWTQPYTLLTYDNIHEYTDIDIAPLQRFTLPQIADYIRVHVLRDNGGYWLDTDTIMLTGRLPDTDLVGDPLARTNSIGLLCADNNPDMYEAWAAYQDAVVKTPPRVAAWSVMGNDFTDEYARYNDDVLIHPIDRYWPEVYMIGGDAPRYEKYRAFYFDRNYELKDIKPADLIMLHNSWTPLWYKSLTEKEIYETHFTLSNFLRQLLK